MLVSSATAATAATAAAATAADDDNDDARDDVEEGGADGSLLASCDPPLAGLLSELGLDDGEYAASLAPVRCLGSVAGAFEAAAASVEVALAREDECLMAATTAGGRGGAGWVSFDLTFIFPSTNGINSREQHVFPFLDINSV